MYLALIPGASVAYVYGPAGGVISGAFVFIKEWPQYNSTTDVDGTYSINQMPIGEYTLVAAGNDSYAPNITWINVTEGDTNFHDITLSPANKYYLPFLYQNDVAYQAAFQVQNNGTSNSSVEVTFYNPNGTKAGNDFSIVQQGELLNKKVFDITGKIPLFVGSYMVKSDSSLMNGGYIYSIGKDVYSLAPAITDADLATSAYIPFLYNSGAYNSGVQVLNPGNETANVTVTYYNPSGGVVASNTLDVPPKNLGGPAMPAGLIGSAEITANQSIVAQGFIRTTASSVYSIAPALITPVTSAYIPFLYNSGAYNSGVQVFNPGSVTANVTVTFYNPSGGVVASNTFNVPPKNLGGPTMPAGLIGSAEITANQSIVTQGFIRTIASSVYSVAPQVRKPGYVQDAHIPYLYSTTSSHDSGVQVLNPNSQSASANIIFYYSNGTEAYNYSNTVLPYGLTGIGVKNILPGVNFTGYVKVTANQSIVTQGYIRTTGSNVYSIAPPVER